jgi:8-oxo-dGTP pyrophosphatase MutT (NUDIX family)
MTLAYIKKDMCQDLEGPCEWTGATYTSSQLVFSHKSDGLTPIPLNVGIEEKVAAEYASEKMDLHKAAEFLSRDVKEFKFDKYETMDPRKVLVDGSNWMDPKPILKWSFGWGKDLDRKELAKFLDNLTKRNIYDRLLAEPELSPVILVDDYEFGLTLADGWGRAILKYFQGKPIRVARYHTEKPVVASEYEDEGHVNGNWGSQASGVMFRCGNKILLLKRAHWTMDPLLWGIPGGAVPVDQNKEPMDIKQSAIKETTEEIGGFPEGYWSKKYVNQKPGSKFKYTTFVVEVDEEFNPILNDEHLDFDWVDLDKLPQDVHPGVAWVVKKLGVTK